MDLNWEGRGNTGSCLSFGCKFMVHKNIDPDLGGRTYSGQFSEVALHSYWQSSKSGVSAPELQQENDSLSLCQ